MTSLASDDITSSIECQMNGSALMSLDIPNTLISVSVGTSVTSSSRNAGGSDINAFE